SQINPIVVGSVGHVLRRRFGTHIENPLLRRGIEVPAEVICGIISGFVNRRNRATVDLVQAEVLDDACPDRVSIRIADPELCRYGASRFPDAGAVGVNRLENLMPPITVAHRVSRCVLDGLSHVAAAWYEITVAAVTSRDGVGVHWKAGVVQRSHA